MPESYWRVYNYVARQWYEQEMGRVEYWERWYWNALPFLEEYGAGLIDAKGNRTA